MHILGTAAKEDNFGNFDLETAGRNICPAQPLQNTLGEIVAAELCGRCVDGYMAEIDPAIEPEAHIANSALNHPIADGGGDLKIFERSLKS